MNLMRSSPQGGGPLRESLRDDWDRWIAYLRSLVPGLKDEKRRTKLEVLIEEHQAAWKARVELITRLEELPDDRCVRVLTSHFRLGFHTEDGWPRPLYVTVDVSGPQDYAIAYRQPRRLLSSEKDSWVTDVARSEEAALRMILEAMEKSEGWKRE